MFGPPLVSVIYTLIPYQYTHVPCIACMSFSSLWNKLCIEFYLNATSDQEVHVDKSVCNVAQVNLGPYVGNSREL